MAGAVGSLAPETESESEDPLGHEHHPPHDRRHGPPAEHRAKAPRAARVFVVTVSDTRTEETDKSGRYLRDALAEAGHTEVGYALVKDERDQVLAALDQAAAADAQVILTNGGTGIARRDRTYEAVVERLDKEITGFGELFRMLSYEDIGAAAMLSRATAGVWGERIVACLPGSTGAVKLAWTRLLEPELGHLVHLASS